MRLARPAPPTMIRPLHAGDAFAIARIDVAARPGDLLPMLGAGAVGRLYGALLDSGGCPGLAAVDDGRVVGFVLGALDTRRAMRVAVGRTLWALLPAVAMTCARHPSRLLSVVEAPLYGRKVDLRGPELLVIAVHPDAQGRGLGGTLVEAFDETLRGAGQPRYHVSAKARNQAANRFYARLGFVRVRDVRMFRETWNVYERALPPRLAR